MTLVSRIPPGFYIYCWTNEANGRQYVGKGTGRRAWQHTYPSSPSVLSKAMRKYGLAGFRLQILADGLEEEDAFKREAWAIHVLDTYATGYNFTLGGEGMSGHRPTQATREAASARLLGRKLSPETAAKSAASRTGLKQSEATKQKRSRALKGRTYSEESLRRMSEGQGTAPGTRESALALVASGASRNAAARAVGVAPITVGRWLKKVGAK